MKRAKRNKSVQPIVSSKIHKKYADADLRKAPALFDLCEPRYKKFACIHEPGKNSFMSKMPQPPIRK